MAKKKKRGRPKGSGGGPRKKNETAPKNLNESHDCAKHIKDQIAFITSSISYVGRKGDDIGVKGQLKKINLAKQALTQVGKEVRDLGSFFRDFSTALREEKKAEANKSSKKKGKKKDKKKKKNKKKKKKRDDDDD